MVNEDILTALKNSVERGESLEEAKVILKDSGYNEKEIEDASSFVGKTPIQKLEPKPDEKLTMPGKKGFFSGLLGKKEEPQKISPSQIGEIEQIKQEISPISQTPQITQQTNGVNLNKPSHLKEIILVVVLLVLVGLLITTVLFKNQFLKLFS